ncbi:CaiB/BaiF CoA transferase family protein [Planktotalea arctica]|uniref:CaiB/BaiF CoA transferase family protein n=1 Tax=Planktotalea arctica TaxID=1481893 RepID=UPI000A16EC8E|nr:CaiB/BaiF CoA-transferase family protein [Planktotalea arctica]
MLEGIKIVEIEGLGPAPFAGMMLADLGADVTVIHRKGKAGGVTAAASLLDRGKRSIDLDLKDAGDLEIARKLIARADGVIEGFRPGVMERLGLGPEKCRVDNPKLVYGRMTGWGQTGPRAQQAGHDLNYIATSGALHYASLPSDAPVTPATLVGDIGGGALYLVAGMLAGIIKAARTGQGTVVDAAIVDGSAHMMNLLMALGQGGGLSEGRGQSLLDGPHWSRTYRCACGGFVSVQALEPQFYAALLAALDLGADASMHSQHDARAWPAQIAIFKGIFAAETRAHWAAHFADSEACVAAVLSPQEAACEPHIAARGIWAAPGGTLQAAPAPRFDAELPAIAKAPERGADRVAILAEIGVH